MRELTTLSLILLALLIWYAALNSATAQTFDPRTGTMVQPQQYQYQPPQQYQPPPQPPPQYVQPQQQQPGLAGGSFNPNSGYCATNPC